MANFGKAPMGCQTIDYAPVPDFGRTAVLPDQASCRHSEMVYLMQPARLTRFIFLRE